MFKGIHYRALVDIATNEEKKKGYVSLFLSLACACVQRPPPALPIPLLVIVMSEKSSGRGCWQGFDWVAVLAPTSPMKRLQHAQ